MGQENNLDTPPKLEVCHELSHKSQELNDGFFTNYATVLKGLWLGGIPGPLTVESEGL